jgi:hypothetical protein
MGFCYLQKKIHNILVVIQFNKHPLQENNLKINGQILDMLQFTIL